MLLFALLLGMVPALADYLERDREPTGNPHRWGLKLTLTLVLVFLMGFADGQWPGLGYVLDQAGTLIFFFLVLFAFSYGKPFEGPSPYDSHLDRPGPRGAT